MAHVVTFEVGDPRVGPQPFVELALAAYFGVILFAAVHFKLWMGIPFTLLFFAGFLYIGISSLTERRSEAGG